MRLRCYLGSSTVRYPTGYYYYYRTTIVGYLVSWIPQQEARSLPAPSSNLPTLNVGNYLVLVELDAEKGGGGRGVLSKREASS